MASPDTIAKIWGREVLNFRGNPTVEAWIRGSAVVFVA